MLFDAENRLPVYVQVQEWIRERIQAGEWARDTAIPPERELAARLGVNRLTVSRAVSELVNQGLLARRRGIGTFVRRPLTSPFFLQFSSISQALAQTGYPHETRLVDFSAAGADQAAAAALAVAPGAPVLVATRLRLLDGSPLLITTSVLPAARCPLTREDVADGSIYRALRRLGREPVRTEQTIGAQRAGHAQARLLGVGPGEVLLSVEGVAYDAGGEPVEDFRNYALADRIRFSFRHGKGES